MKAMLVLAMAVVLSLATPAQPAELARQSGTVARLRPTLTLPNGIIRPHGHPSGPRTLRSLPALAKPAGIDLDVAYISRAPLYDRYDVWYTAAGTPYLRPGSEYDQRWPALGEQVTFTAHFANKGTAASGSFAFKWFVDGVEVLSGMHASLAAGQAGTEIYRWTWAHQSNGERLLGAHDVRFTIDPANIIAETYKTNNSIEDRTDALSLVVAVTPALYAALETPTDPKWPFSAEDWLQKQIAAINAAFARSVYSSTPSGVVERVRLENIVVTSAEPPANLAIDGFFYLQADDRAIDSYYDPATDVSGGLIHELTHQLGIIDTYNLDATLEELQLADRTGQPVEMEYVLAMRGLMNQPGIRPPIYEEHTALALNANKGYRRGYYGEYLYDVPATTSLRILDNRGNPAPGVDVRLYQRIANMGPMGKARVDATPEIVGVTDSTGTLLLTNRPVGQVVTTHTGHTLRDNPLGVIDVVGKSDQFLVELSKGAHQEYFWLDITRLNLAAWRGESAISVVSHVPAVDAPAPPTALTSVQSHGNVTLHWQPSPSAGVVSYSLYRTGGLEWHYNRVAAGLAGLNYTESYNADARAAVYAVTAVDAQGRESGFSNLQNTFRLLNPAAVVIDDQNRRVVLDPQNGYALLTQSADGRLADVLSSVDYHLEFSDFLARDARGRLIIAHPGDSYSSRHSIRVADQEGWPELEFGEQGSGPGQFQNPAGVAAWGTSCGVSAPYAADAHTLLLLHFDGNYAGAQGELGTPGGTTFADGKYAQGVQVDSNDILTYATQGNLSRLQGAVEFWLRPSWEGGDGREYTFFEVGNEWFNRLRIMKDGADNLRFMVWDSTTEYGVGYNVGSWRAGEWHHIAATWQGNNIALYVDGEQRDASGAAHPPDTLAASINVGSSLWNDQQANALIDELRISDIPRVFDSDTCTYRIVVADSGNNRLQVFDRQGQLIGAYGQAGAGPGQFNNPQGLAIDAAGRLIVADSGNNRLQVLSFDGTSFGYIRSIAGAFNQPIGVAAYGGDRIVVADTGGDKIKVLNGTGSLLASYAGPNDGQVGAFSQPRGVAIDRSAAIVVADTGNARVVTIRDALPAVAPSTVAIDGPAEGSALTSYSFGATVLPALATWPISYTWRATDLPAVQHRAGASDTATFRWTTPGAKTVSVTVANAAGTTTSTRQIVISQPTITSVYLPLSKR